MEKPTQLISPGIAAQIVLTRQYLIDHPKFSFSRARAEYREIKRNANQHSVEMEISPKVQTHKYARREGLRHLTDAQRYIGSELATTHNINEEMLRRTAAYIQGYEGTMTYRDVSAFANQYNYQYEDPSEISNKIFLFLEENAKLATNFEKSLHSHFHIARIHPFSDGNGRLARLTANALIFLDRLPPVQIHPFERKKYCDLINAAQREYREIKQMGDAQRTFYDYLAIKVQYSLDKIGEAILK